MEAAILAAEHKRWRDSNTTDNNELFVENKYQYLISLSKLPKKYYGRTMMRSFYFRGGRVTAVAMRQL